MNTFEKLEASGFVNMLEILQRSFGDNDLVNEDEIPYEDSDTSLIDAWKDIAAGGTGLVGNNLATFIVRELMETWDPDIKSEFRGIPAVDSLTRAISELKLLHLQLCASILGKAFDNQSFPDLEALDSFDVYGMNTSESKINEHKRYSAAVENS